MQIINALKNILGPHVETDRLRKGIEEMFDKFSDLLVAKLDSLLEKYLDKLEALVAEKRTIVEAEEKASISKKKKDS